MNNINFVEIDSTRLIDSLISLFEESTGEVFYPGDERRQFLSNMAPAIVAIYSSINNTGRQNLLRYATGELLDALGERTDTPRLQPQKASVIMRFTLSAAQTNNITIAAGTRVTPDGKIYFATKDTLVIPAGSLTGDVASLSVEAGASYNGFTPGQISKLVDPVAYVSTVVNIDTSSGGADLEPDDDGINTWSGYRERIRQSPAKMSTAGPEDAYMYWAKTADQNISDISITSPSAGQVKITVLMQDGEIPSQAVLDKVYETCNNKKVRPLTDQVITAAPETVTYNIDLTYYVSRDRAAEVNSIRAAIENSGGVVEQYKIWQSGKLGRAINPDSLKQLLLNVGAFRADITSPVYTEIGADAVAACGTMTINYGGLI
ncbi:baseplate assembly protein [Ruminiclostridium josui]|uniref:baseplate assembly protein n=1 Tax=Ruminiclostridium josui TaxID=1499 RepID=UPI000465401B|nr:baseplate J/gp47 family protein [Ruminiclostridium josui]